MAGAAKDQINHLACMLDVDLIGERVEVIGPFDRERDYSQLPKHTQPRAQLALRGALLTIP